jgi:hypothetical protein
MPLSIASFDARARRETLGKRVARVTRASCRFRLASAVLWLASAGGAVSPGALPAQATVPAKPALPSIATSAIDPGEPIITPFANFYIAGGQAKFDVSGINARFNKDNGFFALSGDAYTSGLGFYIPIGGILAGLDYEVLDNGFESTPAGRTDVLSSAMIQGRAGFRLFSSWNLTIHGDLQLGGGIATIKFRDRTGGAGLAPATNPTWDEILVKPGAESELRGRFYFIAPGVGFDYIFLTDAKSQRGFTLGVQVATSLAPHRTAWTYGGHDVFGAPDGAPVGAQVRVTLGYGGFSLKKP